jgi:hypothetical protein
MTTDYHDFSTKDMPKEQRRKLGIGDIWMNAVTCHLCKATVRSKNRHDMSSCYCGNVCVDGGSHYIRRIFTTKGFTDVIEYYSDVEPMETRHE